MDENLQSSAPPLLAQGTDLENGLPPTRHIGSTRREYRGDIAIVEPAGTLPALYGRYFNVYLITLSSDRPADTLSLSIRDCASSCQFLPATTMCIVYDAASHDEAETILSVLRTSDVISGVPILQHSAGLPDALAHFSTQLAHVSRRNVDTLSVLSALRRTHEELQGSYDSLRSYVADRGIVLPAIGFMNPPDKQVFVPPEAQKIRQFVPVVLREICGLSLHISEVVGSASSGSMIVELYAPNDDAVLFSWSIDCSKLESGWLNLCFEQDQKFTRRSAALRIYRLDDLPMPALSLGIPQLWEDKAAFIDGAAQDRSLAFKVWISVPGAPLVMTTQIWPSLIPGKNKPEKLELTINDELELQDMIKRRSDLQFHPVTKLLRRNRISVHPLAEGPTVARVVGACPAGTERIFAEIETDNAEAGSIVYGIGTKLDLSKIQPDHYKQAFDRPSDWITVPAKMPGFLEIRLARPLQEAADLFLITALADKNQSWAPCWAHFTRIWFTGSF